MKDRPAMKLLGMTQIITGFLAWPESSLSSPSTFSNSTAFLVNMIQRSLLRQARSLRPTSIPISASSATRTHIPSIQRLALQSKALSSRNYSTAAESTSSASTSEPPPTNAHAQEATPIQESTKTELEAKNREIIDLKVSRSL